MIFLVHEVVITAGGVILRSVVVCAASLHIVRPLPPAVVPVLVHVPAPVLVPVVRIHHVVFPQLIKTERSTSVRQQQSAGMRRRSIPGGVRIRCSVARRMRSRRRGSR